MPATPDTFRRFAKCGVTSVAMPAKSYRARMNRNGDRRFVHVSDTFVFDTVVLSTKSKRLAASVAVRW